MEIKQLLDERFPEMTLSERKIYRRIQENSTLFSLKTISQVAKELSISSATLVRFAQSLGFKGYTDFKQALQREEILSSTPAARMQSLIASKYATSMEQMLSAEQTSLSEMVQNIDLDMFKAFVNEIEKAKKTYVLGWRESAHLASILQYRLQTANFSAVLVLLGQRLFAEGLIHAPKGSLAIIFDYFPYSNTLLQAAEYAKSQGMKIALITDVLSSKICNLADFQFFCPSRTEYLFNSMVAPIFFINAVLSELFELNSEDFVDFLSQREKLFKESGEFYS